MGIIVVVAGFWRWWGWDSRWVFNQDQARDSIIALYANRNLLIPIIGSPSSAGPFNFGPWYFWLIMTLERIIPVMMGPWIGFSIMSLITVLMYADIGKIYSGKRGMIIGGMVAATAFGPVANSADMLNTVITGTTSALALWATAKLIESEKIFWAVLVGMGVGWSINSHFQSWGLMGLMLCIVLINKFDIKKRLKWAVGLGGGWLFTFLPLLWFDISHNWVWVKSVVEYYTVGVNKFYVPVRWLTEIRDFWPQLMGSVITGIPLMGYVIGLLILIMMALTVAEKIRVKRYWLVVGVSLVIQIILIRFYKGVRSPEYFIAIHGYLILATVWMLMALEKQAKWLGLIIMTPIVILAMVSNYKNINKHQSQARAMMELKMEIDEVAEDKVRFEQYQQSDMVSLPMFYLYYRDNRIGDGGTTISFCDGNRYTCPKGEIFLKNNYRVYVDKKFDWDKLTAENIYDRLMVNYGEN